MARNPEAPFLASPSAWRPSARLGLLSATAAALFFSAAFWAREAAACAEPQERASGAEKQTAPVEPILAGGAYAPAAPTPCAPPPWVKGGAERSSYGPPPDPNFVPMQYGPPPAYSFPAEAPQPTNSSGTQALAPNPDATPPPVYSRGAASGDAITQPPSYATDAQTPAAQTYAFIPPLPPTLPPAPQPPAYRTAIAPKLPPFLAVLSALDLDRYARAYAAGDAKLYASADALLAQVEDPVLLGSVLARRYAAKSSYNARYAELYAWLVSYSDNAQADSIYALALPKMTPDAGPPPRPEGAKPRPFATAGLPPQPFAPRPSAPASKARIDSAEQSFYMAQPEQALGIASAEFGQALDGDARYIAGLANFRLGRFHEAAQNLDIAARTPYFSQAEIAAAAFWAGRAHLAAGETQQSIDAFSLAAAQPLTFYGVLAERQLGRDPGYRPAAVPPMDAASAADLFDRYPAAKRAAALAQLGHLNDAEAELKNLQRRVDPSEDIRLLSLAQSLGLASAATRLAELGGVELAAGLYPDTPYAPSDGFRVNKALLFGIARQESRLNPEAVSASNARGLMQLLPSTAAWIGNNPQYKSNPDLLFDPAINMRLGQVYVEHLFDEVSPDLVRVLAAYNMGPGALKRWLASVGDFTDPLLLIESIPKDETRTYVKRVLANMWLYESRFGDVSPTLEAMASGRTPVYSSAARMY